ncbi:response regulator [Skermanella sp. TT6]|uniref:Response regulator n=1 Tax=Skermanella cutis TaxID=2775420 RepID=A0ABX7B6W0_9PROT|nr:response regulator [Skermanella sp. TT6]QQP90067.1 response regulator [Skermanella sp. TT6]
MIARAHRSRIGILMGEGNLSVRIALKSLLQAEGFSGIVDVPDIRSLRTLLEGGSDPPDVVVLDADLEGEDPCGLVRAIRHGKLGRNPFVTVIMTTSVASNERVRAIVESGADGLLVKPLSVNAVMERLVGLVRQRKPFIVTSAYIGPDRRKDPARGPSSIPLFDVPNTLRAKAEGHSAELATLDEVIARAQRQIDEEKRRRDAFQVSFLAGLIVSGTPALNDDSANREYLESLIDACDDLLDRLPGTPYAALVEMVTELRNLGQRMVNSGRVSEPAALRLLRPLSDAIMSGLNPDRAPADLSEQVNVAIRKYRERVAAG